MTEALNRVGELRVAKQGWGEIAKELAVKLDPVVSEVQRVRQEMRAQARLDAGTGTAKPGRQQGRLRKKLENRGQPCDHCYVRRSSGRGSTLT
jgi:hypothetical protein